MSFRRYGGVTYNAKNNIVKSNYNTSANLSVTGDVGQNNSYINFLSDISGSITMYGNGENNGFIALLVKEVQDLKKENTILKERVEIIEQLLK